MLEKQLRKIIYTTAIKRGFSEYSANSLSLELFDDFFKNRNVSLLKKLWAYQHGFFSDRVDCYGLNRHNINEYVPDFPYLKHHPLNGKHSYLIDNKLRIRTVFEEYAKYMPKYYFEITKGSPSKIADCPNNYASSIDGILDLLKDETHLVAKPVAEEHGKGFLKLSFTDNTYAINNQPTNKANLYSILNTLNNYIITEFVPSHPSIQKVYKNTTNTLRLMVINVAGSGPQVCGAFMRFGTNQSGAVDNASAGGVFCGVDINNGQLFSPKQTKKKGFSDITHHPDSGIIIEGKIPNWEIIITGIKEIGNAFAELAYMGYDIIITEKGFKFIEINSFQALKYIQPFYPLMKNKYAKELFSKTLFLP